MRLAKRPREGELAGAGTVVAPPPEIPVPAPGVLPTLHHAAHGGPEPGTVSMEIPGVSNVSMASVMSVAGAPLASPESF